MCITLKISKPLLLSPDISVRPDGKRTSGHIKNLSGIKVLLLIIEFKINYILCFDNTDIIQTNCQMYMHYTVQLYFTLYHKDKSSVS